MNLVFKGIVSKGNAYRIHYGTKMGAIYIGSIDLIGRLERLFNGFYVTIHVGEFDSFYGRLRAHTADRMFDEDEKYDRDYLYIGDADLIQVLDKYAGQDLSFYVSTDLSCPLEDYIPVLSVEYL